MDDLTAHDFPESQKDQVEVFVSHYGIKLADEKNILRWLHVCKRQVVHSASSSGKVSSGSSPSAILTESLYQMLNQGGMSEAFRVIWVRIQIIYNVCHP